MAHWKKIRSLWEHSGTTMRGKLLHYSPMGIAGNEHHLKDKFDMLPFMGRKAKWLNPNQVKHRGILR
jgi:hypothetical protein